MKLKKHYLLFFLIITTCQLLKAQPNEGEAGSKGSYRTQGFSTVLSENENVKVKHYDLWYEGVKIISGQYSQDKRDGLWRQTNLKGDIFFQGYYIQDKKTGSWKYLLNRKPLCTIYYKNDKMDSICRSYYENGKTQCIINYTNGLKNGIFKLFYENGDIEIQAEYNNNIITGNCITYFRDSLVRTNIEYKKGNPYNVNVMNDSLGRPVEFGQFKNGNGPLKTYHNDGKIYRIENFADGLKNGSSRTYFNDGEVSNEGEYFNGQRTGEWIHYNSSGKMTDSIFYKVDSSKTNENLNKDNDIIENMQGPALIFTERMPDFQGGNNGLMQFIKRKITHPVASLKKGISGTVYVTFEVTTIGSLSNISILRGVTYDYNYESVRVVNLMPPWTPGFRYGFPIDVKYTLPIKYTIR